MKKRFTIKRIVYYRVFDNKTGKVLGELHADSRDARHVAKGLNWTNDQHKKFNNSEIEINDIQL